jgi:homopolymeric O-antigen transport system ATP-binding protein
VQRIWARQALEPDDRDFWALKDISFTLRHGEVLGILGRNGAGKSTLLKVLARITEPTQGWADIYGRVGSLLEVGTGFHPELTGRENLFLSGTILGMTRADVRSRLDEIVAFSGLERFLDTPVKRYSSGMYMRLAFAVAAHLEPEVLVIDEVLAVGDAEFQRKCLGKMSQVASEGRTILFVSHNMAAIERLCTSALLLREGQIVRAGDTHDVVEAYLGGDATSTSDLRSVGAREGSGALRFTKFELRDASGRIVSVGRTGEPIDLRLEYRAADDKPLRNVHVAIGVHGLGQGPLLHLATSSVGCGDFAAAPPNGAFICRIERLPLWSGTYPLHLFATVDGQTADWIRGMASLVVESGDFFGTGRLPPEGQGPVAADHDWRTESVGA